ncbi:hypothetical protein [Longispora albida]|uniref:hypothetical protein n=1 Tax=Longispora albida TaxID=203523 RepID=UPI0003A60D43|nr:hypothetical protein [Longispora albida]
MDASPAAVARTLASGRLPGMAHVKGYFCPLRVRHATGSDGSPLLLVHDRSHLAEALVPEDGGTDTGAVLSIDHPSHGRLWLSGWATRLDGIAARAAALEFAEVNPVSDLLGIGEGHSIYRLDLAEVRLAHGDSLVEVDVDEYLDAEPMVLPAQR